MGLKNLFFNTEGEEETTPVKAEVKKTTKVSDDGSSLSFPKSDGEEVTSFPTSKPSTTFMEDDTDMFSVKAKKSSTPKPVDTFIAPPSTDFPKQPNPYMTEVTQLYETGFAKINKEGVDFYEFFESIKTAGLDNLAAYPMAFNMCRGMNKEFTKESALTDAEAYASEIEEVYLNYKQAGENKLNETNGSKSQEEASLKNEVNSLQEQLDTINRALTDRKNQLDSIGDKYKGVIETVTLKLEANKVAKNNLIGNINKVASNIKNNL